MPFPSRTERPAPAYEPVDRSGIEPAQARTPPGRMGTRFPRSLAIGASAALAFMGLSGCGQSQESRVRAAIAAKFPNGMRRCLGIASNVVGIHADGGRDATSFYYPGTGVTDPLRRAYVFYAAPDATPVPELVRELVAAGKLHETVVDATADRQVQVPGREIVRPSGLRARLPAYRHGATVIPVAIYETAVQDSDFDYATRFPSRGVMSYPAGGFPSRMYPGPLPPADTSYQVPTVEPYATSIVVRACVPETAGAVRAVREVHDLFGAAHVEADVEFDARSVAWMSTPAFHRATMGPDTLPMDAPRRATILFDVAGNGLAYVRELGQQ